MPAAETHSSKTTPVKFDRRFQLRERTVAGLRDLIGDLVELTEDAARELARDGHTIAPRLLRARVRRLLARRRRALAELEAAR